MFSFERIFVYVILAALVLYIIAAVKKTSPSKQQQLAEAEKKWRETSVELISISIQQAIYLNSSLSNGSISVEFYASHMAKVIQQLKRCDVSEAFLASIPQLKTSNYRDLIKKQLTIANQLFERNAISKDEFIKEIDEGLDKFSDLNKK